MYIGRRSDHHHALGYSAGAAETWEVNASWICPSGQLGLSRNVLVNLVSHAAGLLDLALLKLLAWTIVCTPAYCACWV